MLKTLVEYVGDVSIYGEVALVLFVMVFVSVLLREWLRPRKELDHLENLPLSDGSEHTAK